MTNEKVKYVNIIKALGIIAVVLGHCGFPFTNIIYSYHMSLFFFITGYLYKDSYEKNILLFIWKKFKSLYIPFLLFEVGFVLFRNLFINLKIYNLSQVSSLNTISDWFNVIKQIITFNYTGDNLLSAIWFLKTLFFVNILFITFNIISKKLFNNNELIKFLLLFIISYTSFYLLIYGYNPITYFNPNNKKLLSLFLSIFDCRNFLLIIIYYLGTLYKKYESKIKFNIYIVTLLGILLILLCNWKTIDVASYNFVNPFFFILCSLIGIYMNLYFAQKLLFIKSNFLELIGKNSLYIMLLHFVGFKLGNLIIIKIYNLPLDNLSCYPVLNINKFSWLLFSILGIYIPLILRTIYVKTKLIITSKIFS